MKKNIILQCAKCGLEISQPITIIKDRTLINEEKDNKDLLPRGYYTYSNELSNYDSIGENEIIINLKDLQNIKPGGKRNGCCGIDGLDGINTFCANEHEIGTERSDCWQAHFIHIPRGNIKEKNKSN